MNQSLVNSIVQFHLPDLISTVVWWTILGGIVGLLVGVLTFLIVRRAGWLHTGVRGARWLRALACSVIIVDAALTLGTIGLSEGVLSGVKRLSRDAGVRGKLLPQVGRSGALLVAGVYSAYPLVNTPSGDVKLDKALGDRLDSFARGKWEVNARELSRRLSNTPAAAANVALRYVKEDVKFRCHETKGSRSERVELWLLDRLAQAMLPSAVAEARSKLEHNDLTRACARMLRDLPSEAARRGDPDTISYDELSSYITARSLDSLVVIPLRGAVRSHEVSSALWFLFRLACVVLSFRLLEYLRQRATHRPGNGRPSI